MYQVAYADFVSRVPDEGIELAARLELQVVVRIYIGRPNRTEPRPSDAHQRSETACSLSLYVHLDNCDTRLKDVNIRGQPILRAIGDAPTDSTISRVRRLPVCAIGTASLSRG